MHNHFLVIYPYPHIDSNPTMVLLLNCLANRKESIDVFLSGDSDYLKPAVLNKNINYKFKKKKYFPYIGMSIKRSILNRIKYFVDYGGASEKYSAIIGVDPAGIISSDIINRYLKTTIVYISFEIMFNRELSSFKKRLFKQKEVVASRQASLVLIQDEERAYELCRENDLESNNIALVPNSPRYQTVFESNFLRKKFDISPDKKVVLYCGQLESYCPPDEIKAMVSKWPTEFILVIHMRQFFNKEILSPLQKLIDEKRIFISDQPIPSDEMPVLVNSADYGLAIYNPNTEGWTTGKNIFHMGFSSGKVAHYAMCGLPVIASPLPVYQREFKNYDCGRTYNDPAETGAVLTMLDKDYSFHSRESKRFYEERLDPQKPMDIFCDRLIALGKR